MEKYMGFSLKNKFSIGGFYTKYSLSEIIKEPNLELVREGLYYCKKSESTFLFSDQCLLKSLEYPFIRFIYLSDAITITFIFFSLILQLCNQKCIQLLLLN